MAGCCLSKTSSPHRQPPCCPSHPCSQINGDAHHHKASPPGPRRLPCRRAGTRAASTLHPLPPPPQRDVVERERHRRSITSCMLAGPRQHENFPFPPALMETGFFHPSWG